MGEFLSVPELKENPLVKRVVDVFDDDLSGEVDFKGKDPARNPIPVVQYIATILVSFYLGDCLTRLTAYYRLVFYLVNHKNWVVSNGLKTCKIWRVLANILVSFFLFLCTKKHVVADEMLHCCLLGMAIKELSLDKLVPGLLFLVRQSREYC